MRGSEVQLSKDDVMPLGILFALLAIYLLTFPEQWLINDAYSYFNRALAFAEGYKRLLLTDAVDGGIRDISGSHYALGNSTWLALWIRLVGQEAVFLSSLFCTIVGSIFTWAAVRRAGYSSIGIYWLLLLPSLQFYSRTLMGCMPSFLIVSVFLYLLFKLKDGGRKWFILCVLASFSAWFRETNMLLLGLVCLIHFTNTRKFFFFYLAGALVGLLPRLVSHQLVYGDAFQYLLSEGISLGAVADQLGLYFFLMVAVFPGALFFVVRYQGLYKLPLQIATLATFVLYMAYDYDATEYSGFLRGALVNSRFLIPATPFICLMFAQWLSSYRMPRHLGSFAFTASLLVTVGSQYVIHHEQAKHSWVSHQIEAEYQDELVLYDMSGLTNILRYINPLATDIAMQGDIARIADPQYLQLMLATRSEAVVILSDNQAGAEKSRRTAQIESYLDAARTYCDIESLESILIEEGLY